MNSQTDKPQGDVALTTPGRPTESGSRQQHVPDQNAQTGSRHTDREHTRSNERHDQAD